MLEHALADPATRTGYLEALRHTFRTGKTQRLLETPLHFAGDDAVTFWDVVTVPLRDAPTSAPDGVALFANDVTRLVEARTKAEETERRFNVLVEAGVIGVTVSDGTHFFEANDAFLELVGRSREELGPNGIEWTAITDPTYHDADRRALAALLQHGAAGPYEKAYVRPDGTSVSVLISAARVSDDPLRIMATTYELSARKAAEADVAALLARTRRLQQITAALSASNTAVAIARAVVHHGLEELSASAGVLVRAEASATVEHAVGLPLELVKRWRDFPATLPESLRAPSGMPEPAGELLEGGLLIAVPIMGADGAALGTLALLFREERPLAGTDADFLVALAWQAGLALDRIRLYEDRAYVARKLQEGLLPHRLDEVPGLESAVVYESISGGGEVGGDFYDLFEAGTERWLACVGDVCGKGTDAAVITGLARHTIRAAAHSSDSPAESLAFLNRALRRHSLGAALLHGRLRGHYARRRRRPLHHPPRFRRPPLPARAARRRLARGDRGHRHDARASRTRRSPTCRCPSRRATRSCSTRTGSRTPAPRRRALRGGPAVRAPSAARPAATPRDRRRCRNRRALASAGRLGRRPRDRRAARQACLIRSRRRLTRGPERAGQAPSSRAAPSRARG